ncbi:MAG: hypothetical protein H6558_05605 [Lewinellaceae bacterium]|nr:hypothetical protein [Lewinellaceae bacterium]
MHSPELGKADNTALKEQLNRSPGSFAESKSRVTAVYRLMPIWGAVAAIIGTVICGPYRPLHLPAARGWIVASDSLPGS